MDDIIDTWLGAHGHLCAILFSLLLLPVAHLYVQAWITRRVVGMRKGDAWWLQPPRYGQKGPRKSPRSKVPLPPVDDDKTPA